MLEGALPSSLAKQLDKGKGKVIEHITVEEEDKHETEQEFQLIDLQDEDAERITNTLIKIKDAKISELQANLGREKSVINFLELENQQLKTTQAISEVRAIIAQKEAGKAKALLDDALGIFDDSDDEEDQLPGQILKTIGPKRALAQERKKEA